MPSTLAADCGRITSNSYLIRVKEGVADHTGVGRVARWDRGRSSLCFFASSLHSCRSNLSNRYSSAPTRSRRRSNGVKNLYWHLAQEAMEGTCSPNLRTMTKLRSAMAQSAAINRRSRCGSVRDSPVL